MPALVVAVAAVALLVAGCSSTPSSGGGSSRTTVTPLATPATSSRPYSNILVVGGLSRLREPSVQLMLRQWSRVMQAVNTGRYPDGFLAHLGGQAKQLWTANTEWAWSGKRHALHLPVVFDLTGFTESSTTMATVTYCQWLPSASVYDPGVSVPATDRHWTRQTVTLSRQAPTGSSTAGTSTAGSSTAGTSTASDEWTMMTLTTTGTCSLVAR